MTDEQVIKYVEAYVEIRVKQERLRNLTVCIWTGAGVFSALAIFFWVLV